MSMTTTNKRVQLATQGEASLWLWQGAVYLCRTATTANFERACSHKEFLVARHQLALDGWTIL